MKMKTHKKFHNKRRSFLFPLLFISLSAGSFFSAHAISGDVWRDASLYRDEWGIPHVYGETPFALAFVFGYAQAEDHAEHMLLAYRMANGRLAAVMGESQADSDAFSLKMGHARLAREALAVADPITRDLCEGFAMGVNAWLVDHPDAVPDWADGVQPQDILAFWHAFLMSMAPLDLPSSFRRAPALPSSNAWALAPERSVEERATLVINPHQQHDGFFQWYEAHLALDDMNIYGATLRGLPVIVQGHNEALGWALTPNQSNFADVFYEEYAAAPSNPKDPRFSADAMNEDQALLLHYMSNSLPYYVRTESGLETRYVPAYIGPRGPVFESEEHGLNSWFIGGYNDFGGLLQLIEMARAPSLEAFQSALTMHQMPCFHMVYADRFGNIFYLYNTKSGVRLMPSEGGSEEDSPYYQLQWNEPVSHNLASVAWREVFSLYELPALLNPGAGYIQACGNPPWTATEPGAFVPELWPAWLVQDTDAYRAKRARQLLRSGKRSFRDHQSMLFDVLTPAALDMIPALKRAVEGQSQWVQHAHPDFQEACKILLSWSAVAEVNSTGMTLYHLWWTFVRTRAAADFPTEAFFYEAIENNMPKMQEILLRSVEDAARTLRNEYGVLEVPWGDVHRIRRGTMDKPIAGASSGDPLFLANDQVFDQGHWISTYGYGFAMVVQFGEHPESVSFLPFGASLVPGSPHYADQLDLMLERRFKRVRFAHDDILRNAVRASGKRITLLPLGINGAVTLHSPEVIHARLRTETEAPEPLPRGMIPFSLYIAPERSPVGAPMEVDISIHIPDVLCDAAALPQLHLYRYEPGLSWQPAPFHPLADPATRILYAHDKTPAQWYVVLGPAEAAGQERYGLSTSLEEKDTAPHQLVGLDILLKQHSPQPSAGDDSRRTFRFERHDINKISDRNKEGEGVSSDASERVFRMERLDETREVHPASGDFPLQQIPGMHFGPSARTHENRALEPGKTFHMERLDSPDIEEKQESSPSSSGISDKQEEKPDRSASSPVENNNDVQQPDAFPSGSGESRTAPETSDADIPVSLPDMESQQETVLPDPRETTNSPLEKEIRKQRERPPLPSIIPHDPAFVFGPNRNHQEENSKSEGEGNRKFRMERL